MMENKHTEFKREYTENVKYTVVAFANTEGGKIYIGINDDGSVSGIENTDDTMLRITNMIRDSIRPDVTMFTECATEIMDGKSVVILTVNRGTDPIILREKASDPRAFMCGRAHRAYPLRKLPYSI